MQNFMNYVQDLNDSNTEHDYDPAVWAARAFSMIAVLGGHDSITDEVGDLLARLLSLAPDEVVANGTVMVLSNMAKNKLGPFSE